MTEATCDRKTGSWWRNFYADCLLLHYLVLAWLRRDALAGCRGLRADGLGPSEILDRTRP